MKDVSAAPGPAVDRPRMIIRLNEEGKKRELWDEFSKVLIANKACCDEVWFSTGVGFPTLDQHQKTAAAFGEYADELRAHGIAASLQMSTTLGHGDRIISGNSDGQTWGHYVGVNGEQCQFVNCPRQQGFLDYIYKMSEFYAQWHPSSVWIDDDLRLDNHNPAKDLCGCYCPLCLELFGKEEGRTFTREELVAEYKKDPELYKRWERFGINSLRNVAEVVIRAFHKHSPETRFGLQHCHKLMRIPVLEALNEFSGMRVGSRPGGGAYTDHFPYEIIDKAMLLSMQMHEQPGYDKLYQVCAEIESCPRTFSCKTPQGYRVESMLYSAIGMDSLSYNAVNIELEDAEVINDEVLSPLAADAPCYRDFFEHNQGTLPGGFGLVGHGNSLSAVAEYGLPLLGVPCAAFSPYSNGYILYQKAAETLEVETLEEMFKKGVILDGPAAMALQTRGLSYLIGNIKVAPESGSFAEYYTDDPITDGLERKIFRPYFPSRHTFEAPKDLDVRVVGVYHDKKGNPYGAATVMFEKADGSRAAILGFEGFNAHYISFSRIKLIHRICDWIAKYSLNAVPATAVQCLIVPRITENGKLTSVTVLNPTIGKHKPFELVLRGVSEDIKEAAFNIPTEKPVKVTLRHENGECRAAIPQLDAWGIGWLKIKK